MNVTELRSHLDGYTGNERVLVRCDGQLLEVETVQTRSTSDATRRPRNVFVLVVADGPSDISEPSPITIRSPRE